MFVNRGIFTIPTEAADQSSFKMLHRTKQYLGLSKYRILLVDLSYYS